MKFSRTSWIRKSLLEELHNLDEKEEVGDLQIVEKERKLGVALDLEKITLMVEIYWRHKSQTLWFKEGDKCIKFFHRVANSHLFS